MYTRAIYLLCSLLIIHTTHAKDTIHKALKKGDKQSIQAHLTPETVNTRDESYNTPLHIAAQEGHEDVVTYLIKNGAYIDVYNASGKTPLHKAAKHGHDAIVKKLLNAEAKINAQDKHKETALHKACGQGYTDIVKRLLKHDANPNIFSDKRETPLYIAAKKGYLTIAQLLIQHGAHINTENKKERTALYIAVSKEHADLALFLLRKGAHVDATNKDNKTPLYKAVTKKNADLVVALLAYGASPTIQSHTQETPLQKAVRTKQIDIVCYLLAHGAPLDKTASKLSAYTELQQAMQGTMPAQKHLSAEQALRIMAGHGYNTAVLTYLESNTLEKHDAIHLLANTTVLENFGLAESLIQQSFIAQSHYVPAFERAAYLGTEKQIQRLAHLAHNTLQSQYKNLSENARKFVHKPVPSESQAHNT